jgi:lactoylglutathione lyase
MKFIYTFIILIMAGGIQAQGLSVKLNHIAVQVSDLNTSKNFYENIIGLRQIPDPFNDDVHVWFNIGHSQLHLIESGTVEGDQDKNSHICFSVTNMEKFIDRLEAANITYSDWPGKEGAVTTRPDGIKQIYFRDPDGYWIEVNDDFKLK